MQNLAMTQTTRRQVRIWLFLTALLVFGMVVLGGLTRLTESGLSIVEWKPVAGTFPPLNEAAWQEEFTRYQQSPQYIKVNKGMSVEQFKGIFWLEYLHRLAGRAIGILFLLPILYFATKKQLPGWLAYRLVGVLFLGGLQGVIGWYMVKSGLVNEPSVSQYRLALHLGMAFILIACLLWTAFDLDNKTAPAAASWSIPKWIVTLAGGMVGLVFVQVLLGALVAGLDAGLTYNTFPLMDGKWVPDGLYVISPWWKNHFENVTLVQFQHRIFAMVLATYAVIFSILIFKNTICSRLLLQIKLLVIVLIVQVALGVITLVHVVPIMLASGHQAVAAMLFALSLWVWHTVRCLYKPQDI